MFCPNCGNQIKDGAKFCPKCGVKLTDSAAAPAVNENNTPKVKPALKPVQTQGAKPAANASPRPQSGSSSAASRQTAATRQAPAPRPAAVPPSGKPPKKGGKLTAILIVLLVLVLAAGAGTVYYVNKQKDAKQQEKEKESKKERDKTEEESEEETEEEGESSAEAATEAAETRASGTSEPTTAAAAVPVTCSLLYSSQVDFGGISKIGVKKENVTQSSYVVQENSNIDNTGWSAFDGQATTSWQEGRADDGAGEYVTARFDREYQVSTITFLMGNHRSNEWFLKNNRPKKLKVVVGGQSFETVFPDEMKEFALVFSSPIAASDITVTIEEVYSGSQYRDTVISEIGVYGN